MSNIALYEILGGGRFPHPVEQMNDAEVERFWNRARSVFPVAEDFLHCPTAPAPENWAAGGGDYLVVARGGWRQNTLRSHRIYEGYHETRAGSVG